MSKVIPSEWLDVINREDGNRGYLFGLNRNEVSLSLFTKREILTEIEHSLDEKQYVDAGYWIGRLMGKLGSKRT